MAKLMEINSCRECESNKCNGLIPMCNLPKEGIHKDCPLQDVEVITNYFYRLLKDDIPSYNIDKIIIVKKKVNNG